jgi:pimeloyl-ACP methyl ester carboxylesterase
MTGFHQMDLLDRGSVEVHGGSVQYAVAGSGPTVVFAHGLGGNMYSWWQQVEAFAGHCRCVFFNHRGFAPSRDETGQPQPERFARDLEALLDHLDIERTSIVAQSMGGWTAMEFALLAPERVSALVLSGSAGTLRQDGIASLADTSNDPRNLAYRAEGIHPAAGRRMAEEQQELHRMFVDIDRLSGTWDRGAVRAALDDMRRRSPGDLANFAFPVLAIVGAEDLVCPPANIEILTSSLPQAEALIMPAAGHSAYFERAAAYNEIVMNFLHKSGSIQ